MPLNTVLLLLGLLGGDDLIDHAKNKHGKDLTGISTRELLDLAQTVQPKREVKQMCLKSSKKGYVVHQNEYLCDDFLVLEKYVNFYMDWNIKPKFQIKEKCETIPKHTYIPATKKGDDWLGYAAYLDYNNATDKYFLGYFRPMRTDGANMDAIAAAEKWKGQCWQVIPDVLHVSPSGADCKQGKNKCINGDIEWFHAYFDALADSNCPPYQFMALTWYGCNPDWMINYIRKMWNEFHMPIWVTEFACNDKDPKKVEDFMIETTTRMEKLWYVVRYAWGRLRAAGKTNSLMEDTESVLNSLGGIYSSI